MLFIKILNKGIEGLGSSGAEDDSTVRRSVDRRGWFERRRASSSRCTPTK